MPRPAASARGRVPHVRGGGRGCEDARGLLRAGLRESIQEAGEVLRGLRPAARETIYEAPERIPAASVTAFAVCVQTDDEELLVPRKLYEIKLRGEYARVVDEAGEAAVYPRSYFLLLDLPQEVAHTLRKVA